MRNNYDEQVVEPILKIRKMGLVDDIVKLPQISKPFLDPGPPNNFIAYKAVDLIPGAWVQEFADLWLILQYHLLVPSFYFSKWAQPPSHHNYFSFCNIKGNVGVFFILYEIAIKWVH